MNKKWLPVYIVVFLLTLSCNFSIFPSGNISETPTENKIPVEIQPAEPPQNIIIAFSGNLISKAPVHRDSNNGADLFLGELNIQTGEISQIRILDSNPGAQWFPSFSPDGKFVVYNQTIENKNEIIRLNLSTGEKETILEDARFPAYNAEGTRLYFSSSRENQIFYQEISNGTINPLVTENPSADPFPVGKDWLVYHYLNKNGGRAMPVVMNLTTNNETVFDCPGCGHLSGNPSGSMVAAGEPEKPRLRISHLEANSKSWSPFDLVGQDLTELIKNIDPTFHAIPELIISYPEWGSDETLIVSVQGIQKENNSSKPKTTTSGLFLVDLRSKSPVLRPISFPELENVDFPINTITCGVFLGNNTPNINNLQYLSGNSGEGNPSPQLSKTDPTSQEPLVYLMYNSRNKDPDFPGSADYASDNQAYIELRNGYLSLAKYLAEKNIPWSLQTDWNFLEGTRKYEVQEKDAALLQTTEGKNLILYLYEQGVEIEPHSHESKGYNYADVAWLIEQTGVSPAPVVGGHIYDPKDNHFQDWPRFINGISGLKYTQAFWKPTILMGAATYLHKKEPVFTGVWRPKSKNEYLEHDPEGKMIAVGDWESGNGKVEELVELVGNGAFPGDRMITASFLINSYKLNDPGYFEFLKMQVEKMIRLRDSGSVAFIHYMDIPGIWKDRFDEKGFSYSLENENS